MTKKRRFDWGKAAVWFIVGWAAVAVIFWFIQQQRARESAEWLCDHYRARGAPEASSEFCQTHGRDREY
jgi:hypothetical protein